MARFFLRICNIFAFSIGVAGSGSILEVVPLGDLEMCRSNLLTIYKAIQQYRLDYKRMPNELGDLVPKYVSNPGYLKCPVAQPGLRDESPQSAGERLPAAAYLYELRQIPVTNALTKSVDITLRRWKQLQMAIIGSEVPIVRCTNHARVLNLSFGGEVRESGPHWESDFATCVDPDQMSLEFLLPQFVHLKLVRIPAREPSIPPELLDLTPYYNGSLTGWLETLNDRGLADFGRGLAILNGIAFDIRGVIQLGSRNYMTCNWPPVVTNITVGLYCERLAFLHGTVNEDEGEICRYIVHYEDGSSHILSITYGVDITDWKANGDRETRSLLNNQNEPTFARISVVEKGGIFLYIYSWINPRPSVKIRSIDLESTLKQSSLFLVAVSAALWKPLEAKPTKQ